VPVEQQHTIGVISDDMVAQSEQSDVQTEGNAHQQTADARPSH
jgi:hypothetical protein